MFGYTDNEEISLDNEALSIAETQTYEAYKEVLSLKSAKRIVGCIFGILQIHSLVEMNDYYKGRRSVGIALSNTIKNIDPKLVEECEEVYRKYLKDLIESGRKLRVSKNLEEVKDD